MHTRLNMQDWKVAEGEDADPRKWVVNIKSETSRIDVEAKCPDGTKRKLWVEINDGQLVVHAYDPDHDEPVNVRITKTGILVDSDDRGEKPLNRYERFEEFVQQMARLTTPEEEFEEKKAAGENWDGVTYEDADEMVSDFSDDRLCDEYGAFMTMVRAAKELVK
ncbi:hypothetical protein [Mesorhizobium sp. B2-6-4]|uniref:hypothetical protein n=1 Tax=Mesorhizobium sp. B2-6-4 TaxID=2589913 RepID=UPI00112735CA|nr:hypothetical protein [Mesorhizobium sp. B2-6-4]TPJ51776.1 hypothetical protein FJ426_18905 [Mesorhizobium sp. B2-6-4]